MDTYLLASEADISWGTVDANSAGGGGGGGGGGGWGGWELSTSPPFSVPFSFKAFLRRCKQKSIRQRITISPTTPPTTPPAIAPTFVFSESPDDSDPVAEGSGRVADLAENVGFRV